MFIGRNKEIQKLQKIINSPKHEFGIIYGIRQVGKTALLTQIQKQNPKKVIYFIADQTGLPNNLKTLTKRITTFFKDPKYIFEDYYDLFEYFYKKANQKEIVLIIDEFSYLIQSDKSIMSIFQKIYEEIVSKSKIKIILSGSHLGIMESIDSYLNPLYNRTTFKKIQLLPFDYKEASLFFSDLDAIDKIKFYSIFGGMPFVLKKINPKKDLKSNIKTIFLQEKNNIEEVLISLLGHENKKTSVYEPIFKILSYGNNKTISYIANKLEQDIPKITNLLKTLTNMKLINKEISFEEVSKKPKKTNYSFADPFFKFYYFFIKKNESESIIMNENKFYELFILPQLEKFISLEFEKICQTFLFKKYYQNEKIKKIGRYWANNTKENIHCEIDIILTDTENKTTIFECKWSNSKIDFKIVKQLQQKKEHLKKLNFFLNTDIQLGFFSKNGFDDKLIQNNNYLLFIPDDLYNLS
ncbi:hypothetical protein CWO85_02995 [Candidatus Phytoplasma ziziphi]|uniref:ATPase n=1 Tax=Ziziphus jujuba witches'-broom phytoplasma TaxID=135727 RepID=A0A660HN54_ZIZJU|nr:ATP-binding protein [Candidatus Phytoplasma ziziphi]AYJ01445.1 hypothetical protein CWO85_02995 [Candidatus Phytoplasma ziziphi]